jgi:hypothetical protein
MVSCVVHFYKKVLGLRFSLPQGTVRIVAARNEARAAEAAKRRFARRHKVADWSFRADSFDVVHLGEAHWRDEADARGRT